MILKLKSCSDLFKLTFHKGKLHAKHELLISNDP